MSKLIKFLENKQEKQRIFSYQIDYWINASIPRSDSDIEIVKEIEESIFKKGYYADEKGLINAQKYHDLPGISSSNFRDYFSDPKLFEYNIKNPKPKKYKSHFQIGHAIHAALTGTGKVISESDRQKKNRFLHSFELEAVKMAKENIFLLKDKDWEMVKSWIDTCNNNDLTETIFKNKNSLYEVPMFTLCKETGLLLKFTPDILDTENKVIIDLKTSQGWQSWQRTVDQYGYDIQACFYLWVSECIFGVNAIKDFIFLYLSKVPPFRVSPKAISKERLYNLKFEVLKKLCWLNDNMRHNSWGSLFSKDIEYAE